MLGLRSICGNKEVVLFGDKQKTKNVLALALVTAEATANQKSSGSTSEVWA
jgi:hypothetical protein